MAIRNILTNDFSALHRKSKPVVEFDEKLKSLIEDLKQTLFSKETGVGLAAPQVGVLRCVVVVDTGKESFELVNPKIVEQKGEQIDVEGCLSFPDRFEKVKRPKFVKVLAFNQNKEEIIIEAEDFLARVLCHEIDHLNGIVFLDKAIL